MRKETVKRKPWPWEVVTPVEMYDSVLNYSYDVMIGGRYEGRVDAKKYVKQITYRTEFIGPLQKNKRRPVFRHSVRVVVRKLFNLRVNINEKVMFTSLEDVTGELAKLFPKKKIELA